MHTRGITGRGAGVSRRADGHPLGQCPSLPRGRHRRRAESCERAFVAKDEGVIYPMMRMSDSKFDIRATGFNGGGGGGNTVSIGDINITTQGSSGNAQQDAEHAKMMAREMRAPVEDLVNAALIKQSRGGGLLRQGM